MVHPGCKLSPVQPCSGYVARVQPEDPTPARSESLHTQSLCSIVARLQGFDVHGRCGFLLPVHVLAGPQSASVASHEHIYGTSSSSTLAGRCPQIRHPSATGRSRRCQSTTPSERQCRASYWEAPRPCGPFGRALERQRPRHLLVVYYVGKGSGYLLLRQPCRETAEDGPVRPPQ